MPEPIEVREPYCVYPQVSGDGRWLVAITSEVEPRADWIRELPDGAWRPFLLGVEGTCNGVFDGDGYVAVCTENAPRGRLVRIPVTTAADRETWKELISESDVVLRFVQRAGELLVVGGLREASSIVIVLHPDGRSEELELPTTGLVSRSAAHSVAQPAAANEGTGVAGDADGFSFVLGAPDRSAGLYRYEREAGSVVELRPPEARFPFVIARYEATAPDGGTVGYEVVHRADLAPAGLPAVLYAYGGWNAALVRGSLGANAHLVEGGAALVRRGGGEEGRVPRRGVSEESRHGIGGPPREDADPARFRLGGEGGGTPAWGVPPERGPGRGGARPRGGPPRGGDPPTLVVAGANDMRCPAWHARKFVARLQDEAEGGPFVLRVMGGGHLNTRRSSDVVAEWQGFLLRALGVVPAR